MSINKHKNVLILINNMNLRGGTEIMADNLMRAFNDNQIQCQILSIVPYNGSTNNILSIDDFFYKKYIKVKSNYINKIFRIKHKSKILNHIIQNYIKLLRPDLLINFTYEFIPALKNIENTNTATIFHWSIKGYLESIENIINEKTRIARLISNITYRREQNYIIKSYKYIRNLVTLTEHGAIEINKYNSEIKREDISVIPNFIQYNDDCTTPSSLNNNTVIFVGRLSKEKGCLRLLQIWNKLSHKYPTLKLKIFGEGPEEDNMRKYISYNKLKNITFNGYKNNLEDIYSNADFLFNTSDSEGFGLVLIEAMYFGVIPIAFDCPVSPKEIINNGGITIQCFNIDSFVNKVSELIQDEKQKKALQKNGIARARYFYQDNIIEKWRQMIN